MKNEKLEKRIKRIFNEILKVTIIEREREKERKKKENRILLSKNSLYTYINMY
jgi:hypothetical protein